ncbi:MAG: hypothetical protein MUC60_04555 [Oscillatoria sp. Prado101]|jgi:signal transduction histidine kinase|nr:hypothetical protein [Oscillatoria sp. Prado101]
MALNVWLDPTVGPIAGDADRWQQVVWNLLSSAIKFLVSRRGVADGES